MADGYDVTLVSYHPEDVAPNIQSLADLKIIHKRPKVFVQFQRYFYATRYFHLKRVIRDIRPDLIHAWGVWSYSFLAALADFHPVLVMPFGSDILLHPKKSMLVKLICHYSVSRADMITCDCEAVRKILAEEYRFPEEKIVVFPWGIELDMFRVSVAEREKIRAEYQWEGKKILIMTRHFEPIYGIEYFLAALSEVIRLDGDVRMFLVGDGTLRNKINGLIAKYDLENFVELTGKVSRQELVKYLNASDLYVSSSLSDGTPVTLLEAMACQLPVVVTDIPAVLEWVKDGYNGFVLPARDPQMLASKILTLLSSSYLPKLMGERNLKIAHERADWEKNIKVLENIYTSLVSGNH